MNDDGVYVVTIELTSHMLNLASIWESGILHPAAAADVQFCWSNAYEGSQLYELIFIHIFFSFFFFDFDMKRTSLISWRSRQWLSLLYWLFYMSIYGFGHPIISCILLSAPLQLVVYWFLYLTSIHDSVCCNHPLCTIPNGQLRITARKSAA